MSKNLFPHLPDYNLLRNSLAEEREKISLEEDSDVVVRDSCDLLLSFLESVQTELHQFFRDNPSLVGIFNEEFELFDDFIRRENIIEIILLDDSLFANNTMPFVDEEKQVDQKVLEDYKKFFKGWMKLKRDAHERAQNFLKENFTIKAKHDDIECPCLNCSSEFKTKMGSEIYDSIVTHIDQTAKKIESVVEKTISDPAGIFKRLRDDTLKQCRRSRKVIGRSAVNKLEKRVEVYIKKTFLYPSEIARRRGEVLRVFFTSILKEMGISEDFLKDDKLESFFGQTSLKIWRGQEFLDREFRKQVRSLMLLKRKDISGKILQDYLGEFWIHSLARTIKRKIVYHMGPTNSGKTYYAIEKLSKVQKGCYLAPLRLLAGELYDTLNAKNIKTTLLTGEEVIEVEGATHYSSTVEMARLQDFFDCCVIDEIQMITDRQRGWAWTRAFVNIFAEEVHVCGDASVLGLVEKIVELCGDELVVSTYERMTQLKVEDNPIRVGQLQRSDALVVFSRRNALRFKRELERLDFKVSIVYGRLSPEVRREQARKFDKQETDIMVSTDAIAMGMNLPIRRVVFSTFTKYIDSQEHPITKSEIKQIAGRAGRYKRFPTGYVTCLSKAEGGVDIINDALGSELPQQIKCMVGPDLDIFNQVNKALDDHGLSQLKLSEFLRLFNTISFKKPFYCVDLKEMIELSEMVEESDKNGCLNSAEIFGFACAPVNMGLVEHIQYFNWILKRFIGAGPIANDPIDYKRSDIDYLETRIKCVELYQWLSRHFNNKYFAFDERELLENKSQAVEKLNTLLSEKIVLTCSSCGRKLSEGSRFSICEDCFEQLRYNRRRSGLRKVGGRRHSNKKPFTRMKKNKKISRPYRKKQR